jgi:hypothetical protein
MLVKLGIPLQLLLIKIILLQLMQGMLLQQLLKMLWQMRPGMLIRLPLQQLMELIL